jgi:hypothetical protein
MSAEQQQAQQQAQQQQQQILHGSSSGYVPGLILPQESIAWTRVLIRAGGRQITPHLPYENNHK